MPHNCYFPTGKTLDDSPGLAILVTCDYEGTEQSESTLPCTREDAVEMKKTFDYFNYVVHQLLNPAKADITALLTEVTDSLMTFNAEKVEGGKVMHFLDRDPARVKVLLTMENLLTLIRLFYHLFSIKQSSMSQSCSLLMPAVGT